MIPAKTYTIIFAASALIGVAFIILGIFQNNSKCIFSGAVLTTLFTVFTVLIWFDNKYYK